MKEIKDEQVFPIYRFSLKWSQDGEPFNEKAGEGLPVGRTWGSVQHRKMFRSDPTEAELAKYIADWQKGFFAEKPYTNVEDVTCETSFVERETWCLTWFSHYTFDTGQTDAEALLSFQNFVWRKEDLIRQEGEQAYCLMGAEDRWRWNGSLDGTPDSRTEPPCRCKYCKEQGVIRIGH